jgi:hypothetical protein
LLGRIAVGDTLSFDLLVPSENGPLRPVFSGVKPDPGEQANPLLHNRDMMHVAYAAFMDKAQKAPLAVDAITHGARTSPIVEAMRVLALRGPVDEIELWSDMVNSTGTVDHFNKKFPRVRPCGDPEGGVDLARTAQRGPGEDLPDRRQHRLSDPPAAAMVGRLLELCRGGRSSVGASPQVTLPSAPVTEARLSTVSIEPMGGKPIIENCARIACYFARGWFL